VTLVELWLALTGAVELVAVRGEIVGFVAVAWAADAGLVAPPFGRTGAVGGGGEQRGGKA